MGEVTPKIAKVILLHSPNGIISSELYCSDPRLLLILLGTPWRPLKDPYSLLKTLRCMSPRPHFGNHCPKL